MKNRAPRSNEAPKVYSDIIDFACDLDRTFFANSPSARFYVRAYIPGEFWPLDAHVDRALADFVQCLERARLLIGVTAIEPGRRVRRPLFDLETLNAIGATRT